MSYIEVVAGPMFSKKSSYLVSKYKRMLKNKQNVFTMIWSGDIRSGLYIKTHNGEQISAISVNRVQDVFQMSEYKIADKIIIDEGHFFEDLSESVLKMAHEHKKEVLIGGLYADYMAVPFIEMTKLIAHSNEVKFLKAFCKMCQHDDVVKEAIYTKFLGKSSSRIIVGGSDIYTPVCLEHFLFSSNIQ